ncbi:MAG: hypothetical protein ACI379_16870 [Nocardioides sp.]|uniref:hypothetical protein n=1 Tax=Nocardioides sp. TaxID=35761 RepID=UPI003F0EBA4E
MSDLQCPARLFVGWPAGPGDDDVARWREELLAEGVHDVVDLRGRDVGVVELSDVADVHRGEAVLVLVNVATAYAEGPGELVALLVDSEGIHRVVP